MACLLVLVVAATVLTGPPGKLTHAALTSSAEVFWRTALPGAPMPEAIRELLRHGTNARNFVIPKHNHGDDPPPMNFKYNDYRSTPRNQAATPAAEVLTNRVAGAAGRNTAASPPTVFFLEEDVRVGGILPFRSTILADTPVDSPPPLRLYTVRAVRAVDGFRFVVCRRGDDREAAGPDDDGGAVYGCRATGPARAYAVGMVGELGETVTAAVVCRTDGVPRWSRARAAFWLLDDEVKPGGGAAVCHAALDAQVIPVKDDGTSSPLV